jgi:monofunctional biosynthetic peptidoglycan transglycosylase
MSDSVRTRLEAFPHIARERVRGWLEKLAPERAWLRPASLALVGGTAAFLAVPYLLTIVYVFADPPQSALTFRERLLGHRVSKTWRDLDQISPNLVRQVIVSEDGRFCEHWGVDWYSLYQAIADENGRPRGASTITMQTAKNLFLWNRPATVRKVFEIPLALYMDLILGKRRIAELYLNVAQWGPGIFGAEAAARHHFGKSAAELTAQEAAQLAAALPAPVRRNAGNPSRGITNLARRLRKRASQAGPAAACVLPYRS